MTMVSIEVTKLAFRGVSICRNGSFTILSTKEIRVIRLPGRGQYSPVRPGGVFSLISGIVFPQISGMFSRGFQDHKCLW